VGLHMADGESLQLIKREEGKGEVKRRSHLITWHCTVV